MVLIIVMIRIMFSRVIDSITRGLIIQFTFTCLCNYFLLYVFMGENKDDSDDGCAALDRRYFKR